MTSTYVDSGEVTAAIPQSNLSVAATVQITVSIPDRAHRPPSSS